MYIYVNLISVTKDYLSIFIISIKKLAFCLLLYIPLHRQNDNNKIVFT